MILCDPFACNTLVLSIMRNLQELLSQDTLPRVSILCVRTQVSLCTTILSQMDSDRDAVVVLLSSPLHFMYSHLWIISFSNHSDCEF